MTEILDWKHVVLNPSYCLSYESYFITKFFWAPLKNLGNHKKSGIPAPLRDARSKNLKFVASFQFLEGTPKISPCAAHILLSAPQLDQNLYRVAVFNFWIVLKTGYFLSRKEKEVTIFSRIVSALLCTVTKQYTRPNSKKNSFRGNYLWE